MEDGRTSIQKKLAWEKVAPLFREQAPLTLLKAENRKPASAYQMSWKFEFGEAILRGGRTRRADDPIPNEVLVFEARASELVGR